MNIKQTVVGLLTFASIITISTPVFANVDRIVNGQVRKQVDPRDSYNEELKRQHEIQQERLKQLEEAKKAKERHNQNFICQTNPHYSFCE
ncbi:MAG: hypothetical protein AAFQ14_02875 [Cyanobacteria bacterium J06621_12]